MEASQRNELLACDAVELASMIASGHASPVDAVSAALARLADVQPHLNAFSHVMHDEAMAQARRAEALQASGAQLPPLFGVPVSIKDLIAVGGAPLAFGSRAFADNRASQDAPAVERLRGAGAIVIGKTTTSELGCKAVGASPLTGLTRSPWDLRRTAGGSSAGAAASVAAGVTSVALGTDGGGSIRIPAALNGLFGFKAQFGRVPVYPSSATPDLAHVAPLARSVRDAALMMQVISGHDARDPTSMSEARPDFRHAAARPPRRLRVAWSPTLGYARPTPEVLALTESALKTFELWGCDIEEIAAPLGPDPAGAWTQIFYTQVAARVGESRLESPHLLDPAIVPLLRNESTRSSLAYAQALSVRRDLQEHLRILFQRFDVLVSPTLPVAEVEAGLDIPPSQAGRNLVTWASYTYPFNLSGHPAASIPAGLTAQGHPVGLQVVSRPRAEMDLLTLCAAFEAARPWAKLAPMKEGKSIQGH